MAYTTVFPTSANSVSAGVSPSAPATIITYLQETAQAQYVTISANNSSFKVTGFTGVPAYNATGKYNVARVRVRAKFANSAQQLVVTALDSGGATIMTSQVMKGQVGNWGLFTFEVGGSGQSGMWNSAASLLLTFSSGLWSGTVLVDTVYIDYTTYTQLNLDYSAVTLGSGWTQPSGRWEHNNVSGKNSVDQNDAWECPKITFRFPAAGISTNASLAGVRFRIQQYFSSNPATAAEWQSYLTYAPYTIPKITESKYPLSDPSTPGCEGFMSDWGGMASIHPGETFTPNPFNYGDVEYLWNAHQVFGGYPPTIALLNSGNICMRVSVTFQQQIQDTVQWAPPMTLTYGINTSPAPQLQIFFDDAPPPPPVVLGQSTLFMEA